MIVCHNLDDLKNVRKPIVLAIGFFDGVHLGHRKVISTAMRTAKNIGGETWVLTFDNHPKSVIAPERIPELLTNVEQKLDIIQSLGVDGCIVLHFDRKVARLEPAVFVRRIASLPSLSAVVVGENWRFGRGGKTTACDMARLISRHIRVIIVKTVKWKGLSVSSSRIRSALKSGALSEVKRMLGRPWSLRGTVVHGKGIGRKLGFPTGNLDVTGRALPHYGVYAVVVRVIPRSKRHGISRVFQGVGNLGVKPTFAQYNGIKPVFEFYLFGKVKRLYGKSVEVIPVHKLRDEHCFSDVKLLAKQVKHDCEQASKILKQKALQFSEICI